MKNTSIWSDYKLPSYPKLTQDITCDILIIGGGISGLNLLYHLKNSNLNIVLVEKNTLGSGITCRTTGKLTYFLDNILIKVKKRKGFSAAQKLAKAYQEGVDISRKIISQEMIACDLEKNTAYLTANNKDQKYLKELKNIYHNPNIYLKDKNTLVCKDSYVFHPLKYLDGLLHTLNNPIYENTLVYDITKKNHTYLVKTLNGTIKCQTVVFAGFYPYFIFPMVFPLNVDIEKSYISAIKTTQPKATNGITYTKPTMSYRYYQNYLLKLEKSHNLGLNFNPSKKFKALPSNSTYLWSNTDIMTIDGIPYAGKIKENMYILTGYNTWGMAGSSIASKIVSDEILGKENIYSKLFAPKRNMGIYRIIKWGKNIFTNSYAYLGSMLYKNPQVAYKKNSASVTLNGTKHIVKRKCPHLGCNLIYNEVEKTWDCPCHASRFNLDGKVISGPSRYDISVKRSINK